MQYDRPPPGVRAISILEFSKGMLALLGGASLLTLVHGGSRVAMLSLIQSLDLDPAQGYPSMFLAAASSMTDSNLLLLFSGGLAYSIMRFVEAYGLWFGRRWAEWFAALSGAIYIPFELYKLAEDIEWIVLATLSINVLIVGYLGLVLYRSRVGSRALAGAA